MSQPMANAYNPIAVESAWYDWWETQGYFKPQLDSSGKPKKEGLFVIPAPPPNVTGSLHIGHGLTTAIQDTLVRWNRMLGKTTLFVPGFDHAGISTQAVVESRIWKLERKTRHDYGRDVFLEKVWAWKDE
jgi:valyl-tRNA synthetase